MTAMLPATAAVCLNSKVEMFVPVDVQLKCTLQRMMLQGTAFQM